MLDDEERSLVLPDVRVKSFDRLEHDAGGDCCEKGGLLGCQRECHFSSSAESSLLSLEVVHEVGKGAKKVNML